MPQVLVGRDATLFSVGGVNASDGSLATPKNFLGIVKDFSVNCKKEWVEVSASSALEQERRRTLIDWSISMNVQIRSGGCDALTLMLQYDFLQVLWQDELNGMQLIATGGIESVEPKYEKGERTASIQMIDTGTIITNGFQTLQYGLGLFS